jgi:hypothetical protein
MVLSLGFIVPVERENRWSDLLAVLVEADPGRAAECLGLGALPAPVSVRREVDLDAAGQVDLLVSAGGQVHAVIEVKLLSGLGGDQLRRYHEAFRGARHHIVIFPARLVVDVSQQPPWRGVSWEQVLGGLAASSNPWVAETAQAWIGHLENAVPAVDGHTRWNDIPDNHNPVTALRVRMSWIFSRLQPPAPITHDLVTSSAGKSAVVRTYRSAAKQGYQVIAEVEERLAVQDYPRTPEAFRDTLKGPSVKVCLMQRNVTTSAGFDWDYLRQLWPVMAAARSDWVTTSARPTAPHDREAWRAMVDKGGPPYLGIGFGEAQAKSKGECMFGARFQLPPDVDLATVVVTMRDTAVLVQKLAAQPPASDR